MDWNWRWIRDKWRYDTSRDVMVHKSYCLDQSCALSGVAYFRCCLFFVYGHRLIHKRRLLLLSGTRNISNSKLVQLVRLATFQKSVSLDRWCGCANDCVKYQFVNKVLGSLPDCSRNQLYCHNFPSCNHQIQGCRHSEQSYGGDNLCYCYFVFACGREYFSNHILCLRIQDGEGAYALSEKREKWNNKHLCDWHCLLHDNCSYCAWSNYLYGKFASEYY